MNQGVQRGLIGIGMYAFGYFPLTNSEEDVIAVQRARDFMNGWIAHPLIYGDYPSTMKRIVGSRLPVFTDDEGSRLPVCTDNESQLVKGSTDFIGMIHYSTFYIKDNSSSLNLEERDHSLDMGVELIFGRGNSSADRPPNIGPEGLEGVLQYIKEAYKNIPIYIYENGESSRRNSSLEDTSRVEYLHAYIGGVLNTLRNGSNVRGYFVWSFLDVLELLDVQMSFGLYYVDLDDPDLRRYPKLSAHWYSHFLKGGSTKAVDTKTKLATSF